MQQVLGPTADRLGWVTRFNQRKSKLSGSVFVQALVFSGLDEAAISYPALQAGALDAGVAISGQGLEQRFSEKSAKLCQGVLEASMQQVIVAQPSAIPLLERFAGVYIRDSSVIQLPKVLHEVWAGVGDKDGATAAVKLQVRLDYRNGQLAGPTLQAGREHDSHSPYQKEALPRGALRMGDLGYFSLRQFQRDHRRGSYTLSRYKVGTLLYDETGQAFDLLSWLRAHSELRFERTVYLGKQVRFPCRLLVEQVPQAVAEQRRRKLKSNYGRKKQVSVSAKTLALAEWTLLITDVPPELLSVAEALVLLAVRWQIELLFRLWKSLFLIDEWRSHNPWRILTELYAKLIGVVLLHWTFLVELWRCPDRSWWKAALSVRRFAVGLANALAHPDQLEALLAHLQEHFRHICHLNPRRGHPNTYQRLLPP